MRRWRLVLLIALSAGCAHRPTLDEIMSTFIDHPQSDLLAAWGTPKRVMRDGTDQIWIYYEDRRWVTPGYASTSTRGSYNSTGSYHSGSIFGGPGYSGNTMGGSTSQTYYTPPQTYGYVGERMFFINKAGIIYRYSWRGK